MTNKKGMGWIPDYPDLRDYTEETEEIKGMLGARGIRKAKSLPGSVDLREWCSPIEDQGQLGACTAHAGVGVISLNITRGKYSEGTSTPRAFSCTK